MFLYVGPDTFRGSSPGSLNAGGTILRRSVRDGFPCRGGCGSFETDVETRSDFPNFSGSPMIYRKTSGKERRVLALLVGVTGLLRVEDRRAPKLTMLV